MSRIRLLALVLLVATLSGSCSAGDPDGEGAQIVTGGPGTVAPVASTEAGGEPGTRQNPVPPGTTVKVGEWEVTFGATALDATAQIMAENRFNSQPDAGRQFVRVPVDVAYSGTESGTPWVDLYVKFLGSGGNTFSDFCSVSDSLSNLGEMFPGARGSGSICMSVPSDQVEGGTWIVEQLIALDDDRVFFALS